MDPQSGGIRPDRIRARRRCHPCGYSPEPDPGQECPTALCQTQPWRDPPFSAGNACKKTKRRRNHSDSFASAMSIAFSCRFVKMPTAILRLRNRSFPLIRHPSCLSGRAMLCLLLFRLDSAAEDISRLSAAAHQSPLFTPQQHLNGRAGFQSADLFGTAAGPAA